MRKIEAYGLREMDWDDKKIQTKCSNYYEMGTVFIMSLNNVIFTITLQSRYNYFHIQVREVEYPVNCQLLAHLNISLDNDTVGKLFYKITL